MQLQHQYTDFDHRLDAKIKRYLENHPGATSLPTYLDCMAAKVDRKQSTPDLSKLNFQSIYQLEQQISELFVGKADRHQIRQDLADYIDQGLEENPYTPREFYALPDRLRRGRQSGSVGVTPDGYHLTAWDEKVNCRRLCPDESREECQRLAREYRPEILRLLRVNPTWELHFVVLTTPNVEAGELKEAKCQQYKQLYDLTRRKWGRDHIKGVFAIQEDPLSKDGQWNIHINAIIVTSKFFDYKRLRKEWGYNLQARWIDGTIEEISKAFLEAVKYAAKHVGEKSQDGRHTIAPGMTSWPFEAFCEWYQAGKGFRRSRSYGCLNGFERNPDKGVALEDVQWVGTVKHDGTGYQLNFKHRYRDGYQSAKEVDLIQAHNSANFSKSGIPPHFSAGTPVGLFNQLQT